MHADLIWLAENEPQWAMDHPDYLIIKKETGAVYVEAKAISSSGCYGFYPAFTKAQHQAARDDLFTQRAEQRQRPNIKTQVTAWHAAEDEILASEMSGRTVPRESVFVASRR